VIVTCPRTDFLAACQLAAAAVPARDLKPVLRNVKAVANGRFTLEATDLECGVRVEVPGTTVQTPGEALLPADRLHAILREATDPDLTVEQGEATCTVRGTSAEFELGGGDPVEFPGFPAVAADRHHQIAAGPLREMVRRTGFAAAGESARYALTGTLWELDGTAARLVATDGKRLAVAEGPAVAAGGHTTKGLTTVVPTKAMQLLERSLTDPAALVRVSLTANEALFQIGATTIYTRLLAGRFPPYRDILPKGGGRSVPLPVGAFHAAVRQASILTDRDCLRVEFRFGDNMLVLATAGATTGRSTVRLPVEFAGSPTEVAFDPRFVTDLLRVLPAGGTVTLDLFGPAKPALFRFGDSYRHLLMPLG
jgi:DNA polymerase-3 subunit beta